MQMHQRKSVFVGCLPGALLLLAALALPGTQAPSRAQEAPVPIELKPLLLPKELAFWNEYLHGNNDQAMLALDAYTTAPTRLTYDELRIAVTLYRNIAIESGQREPYVKRLEFLKNALEPDAANSIYREARSKFDFVCSELSMALRRAGQIVDAEKRATSLGYINYWLGCGPFPNERGQAFDEVLDPEKNIDLSTVFVGKDGQNCVFRPLPVVPVDGIVDVGALFRPADNAAAYMLTAVWAEADDSSARILLASDGPIKAWTLRIPRWIDPDSDEKLLDGNLFEIDVERKLGFDQDGSRLCRSAKGRGLFEGLAKGWNALLVKTTVQEGDWRFIMRLKSTVSWRVAVSAEEVSQALKSDGPAIVQPGGFSYPPKSSRDDILTAVGELLYPTLDRNDSTAAALFSKLLLRAEDLKKDEKFNAGASANIPVLTFLLAEASKSTSRVASGKEENKRRELLEQVLKLDPKAARAALELAKYYSGTFRNPTEADRYAKMAVTLAPKWVEARVFAARVATMKGLDGEVERELNALLKEHPDHPSVLRFAGYYRGLRGDYAGSDELFKRCLEKGDFTDEYCRERLFTRAVERNDTQAALKYAGETRQLNPFDLASSEGLIQLFLATGDLERAMAECERALNICPREDNFLARKGEIYMRMAAREPAKAADFKVKAIAAYREAIRCNPNREDLVHYLEFLAQEKPEWEVKLQENIEARIADALQKPVDGNDPYRVVYRDEITVVNDDGTKSIYFQYAYRICNDDGREVLQELGAPAYSDQVGRCVGARVYRRDGSTEEGRRVESQAMLPPLDVGDIVAVRYRVSDTAQSFFGDFFGAIETLGDNVPVDEVRLVYVLPKARKFYEYGVNGAPKAERREEGDKAIWTFSAKGLARVPREPSQLPLTQMVPTVQVSTYENWKDFGRWYYNLIKKQLEPTPEMKAKVTALTEGKTTERDKARAIYNWVVTNIRYNADWHFGVHGYKPFSAGAIFERCIGDCKDKAIVICTMLGVAGVKAYPVLIRLADSSEPRGREDITLPMPHHFNHAIAYIEYADGKGQFVDGTATFNGFEELPGGDAGAHVVIVRPEGGVQTQIPTPAPAQNAAIEEASLEFLGNGKVKLSVKLTATGDRASFLRAIYLQSGTRATQIENQWARHKPGAKVVKVEANDLANIDITPEVKYEIEIPDAYSTDAQGNIEIAAALNPLLFAKGMAAATARRTDIAMNEPYQWQSTMRIKLPEGRSLEKAASFLSDAHGVTLGVNVEVIDREIVITRKYSSGGGVITAADYPKLREMMLAHDRAEAANLRLVKE